MSGRGIRSNAILSISLVIAVAATAVPGRAAEPAGYRLPKEYTELAVKRRGHEASLRTLLKKKKGETDAKGIRAAWMRFLHFWSKLDQQLLGARELQGRLDAHFAELSESERAKLLASPDLALRMPSWDRYRKDFLKRAELARLDAPSTIYLLAGGPVSETGAIESSGDRPADSQAAIELATQLADRGFTVVYDADSTLAPPLAKATGARGIGVGSADIQNPYLRMEAFAPPGSPVVVTRDSLVGAALLVHGKATAVLDPAKAWRNELKAWNERIAKESMNLGVALRPTPSFESAARLLAEKRLQAPAAEVRPSARPAARPLALEDLSFTELLELKEYGEAMEGAAQALPPPAGSVIFGSAKIDPRMKDEIYEAAYRLSQAGIPVTTGGAGGAMRTANAGAFAGGGVSIGIPIGGRSQLKAESRVFSELHTHSYAVPDYSSRIPLLIDRREFVIFVPGGGGTLKELATTLVDLAAPQASPRQLIFMDGPYYRGLVEWLAKSPLPENLKRRIHLVNSAAALDALVERLRKP